MRYINEFKTFIFKGIGCPDNIDVVEIFKWISDNEYNGEYPYIQISTSKIPNIKLGISFQRSYHQQPFMVDNWIADGIKYIMKVYGYEYDGGSPVGISYTTPNPKYDGSSIFDYEGVIPGGHGPESKDILKSARFEDIDEIVGEEVDTLTINLKK